MQQLDNSKGGREVGDQTTNETDWDSFHKDDNRKC